MLSVSVAPKLTEVVVIESALCFDFLNVKVAVEVAALKLSSPALVIVSVQVPDVEALRVVPSQTQPVALPLATDVIDSPPVPEPPVADVTVSGDCEYGKVLDVALRIGALKVT